VLARSSTPPRQAIEESLADLWQKALGVERIGLYDDFFDLGGDSVMAVRMLAQVREVFAIHIPLHVLFQGEPCIETLAFEIEARGRTQSGIGESEGQTTAEESNRTLSQLFEEQALRTPTAIAIDFEGRGLTYRELSLASGRVGAHLQRAGAEPSSVVALVLDRSSDLIVGLLGALKAGCTPVVIDTELAIARAASIIVDAAPAVVLTRRDLRHRISSGHRVLDVEVCARAAGAVEVTLAPASVRAPACLFYAPNPAEALRGVLVSQRAMVGAVDFLNQMVRVSDADVFVHAAWPPAVASFFELFAPWAVGAKALVLPPEAHRDSRWLIEVAGRGGVTVLGTSAPMLRALLEEPSFARLDKLRAVLCYGPVPERSVVDRVLRRHVRLFGFHGPSEVCGATFTEYRAGRSVSAAALGRVMPSARLQLLDEELRAVAVGATGQLFVGGAALPLGYHRQPELTARSLLPDPFSVGGARLFATGELARALPDGSFERSGAAAEVDAGGYAIKLRDLELMLGSHGANDVAVLSSPRRAGGMQLFAYVAPTGSSTTLGAELRRALAAAVPDLPSQVVFVDAVPRTATGEVDVAALTDAALRATSAATEYTAPRSDVERRLADIWAEVLKLPRVGIHDDFFQIGADSLVATRVVARVYAEFGVEIPLRVFFQVDPTVEGLAGAIEARLSDAQAGTSAIVEAPPIVRTEVESGTVLSFWQESTLAWERRREPSATWMTSRRIRLKGALDFSLLTAAIENVLQRQEALRQVLYRDPAFAPHLCEAREIPVPLLDMSGAADDEVAKVVRERTSAFFALDGSPLVRFLLVRRADDEHVLYFTWHHLIHDAGGYALIPTEILETYDALVAKRAPRAALPIRQTDYVVWERAWFSGAGRHEVEAARLRIAGAPALNLPTDRPRSTISSHPGHFAAVTLDVDETKRVSQLCQSGQITLFMGVVAVVGMHLGQWCASEDVVLITPMSTRVRDEVRGLAGSISNWIPLRLSLTGELSVADVFTRVRLDATQAYAHAEVPASLVYESVDVYGHPLGRVLINMPTIDGSPLEAAVESGGLSAVSEALLATPALCRTELTFQATLIQGRLSVRIRGSGDLFDAATIARCAERLSELFRTVNLDTPIASLR
jgi:non-ribosomal peptide synthetase component F/acyl carrier protein